MRLMLFLKLMVVCLCASLLWFALDPGASLLGMLKVAAFGTVAAVAITAVYPEVRGVKAGDTVSVVSDSGVPSIIGRRGQAAQPGKKNDQIKIMLQNGNEVMGVIESYIGLISPPKVRTIYEERLVD